jgi:hypothetical protein
LLADLDLAFAEFHLVTGRGRSRIAGASQIGKFGFRFTAGDEQPDYREPESDLEYPHTPSNSPEAVLFDCARVSRQKQKPRQAHMMSEEVEGNVALIQNHACQDNIDLIQGDMRITTTSLNRQICGIRVAQIDLDPVQGLGKIGDRVLARLTIDEYKGILPRSSSQPVVPGAALQHVVTAPSLQHIVAGTAT